MKKKDKNFYKKPFDSEEFSEISSSNIGKELNVFSYAIDGKFQEKFYHQQFTIGS